LPRSTAGARPRSPCEGSPRAVPPSSWTCDSGRHLSTDQADDERAVHWSIEAGYVGREAVRADRLYIPKRPQEPGKPPSCDPVKVHRGHRPGIPGRMRCRLSAPSSPPERQFQATWDPSGVMRRSPCASPVWMIADPGLVAAHFARRQS
jgi:hypothetical protein